MDTLMLLSFFVVLFALELIYFKIADRYNIIDKPNHRSSHTKITIRGGGIIFSIALLIGSLYFGWAYGYFLLGLFLISFISFMDDIKPVSTKVRILVHLIAVTLLFFQLSIYNLPFYFIALAFVFVIGTINAVNFMDGINGITGGYALITILTFLYINKHVAVFIDDIYLILSLISLLVFNFFNFRSKAKCFAGDVGSVSIAFIMIFFILQLIIKTNNPGYLLLLFIYGLDTATTVFFRALRRENIIEAHRMHFYQFLANEKRVPHLAVAVIYMVSQVIINAVLINYSFISISYLMLSIILITVIFIMMRLYFEGPKRLLKAK